ncbi:MAG: glycosyltransferase [Actinomycetota bacterium]
MRIAVASHNEVRHDARVLKSAATLKAQGHDVRLFGITAGESENFSLPNGIPVHLAHRDMSDRTPRIIREQLPRDRDSSIWTSFRIQGETVFNAVRADFVPDIVHIHDHVALTAAPLYKEAFGCPLIWDAHEIYEALASLEDVRAAVNARIIEQNAAHVDGFITLNRSIAGFYRDKYPALPEAVLVPNAVERVAQTSYDGRLHAAAGLVPEQKILLFQGGFAPHRGIPHLLEAAALLDEQWTVVFMGWGKLEDQIRAVAEEDSSRPAGRPRVAMVPGAPHDELLSWTAGADLGAIPYENTGLNHLYCSPNKLWEYPAAGVPILATDMPEMKDKIETFGIGFTVGRALDPKEIADKVNALTEDQLGQFARNCGDFADIDNWQRYEGRMEGLFAELAGKSIIDDRHHADDVAVQVDAEGREARVTSRGGTTGRDDGLLKRASASISRLFRGK